MLRLVELLALFKSKIHYQARELEPGLVPPQFMWTTSTSFLLGLEGLGLKLGLHYIR